MADLNLIISIFTLNVNGLNVWKADLIRKEDPPICHLRETQSVKTKLVKSKSKWMRKKYTVNTKQIKAGMGLLILDKVNTRQVNHPRKRG